MACVNHGLITSMTIREYFHEAVTSAIWNQQVDVEARTTGYVVNLLTRFSDTSALFQSAPEGLELRPLALIYADAVEAPSAEHRKRALKQLGDLALFIAGLFPDSLNRKLVDVDYYIAMGGSAYGCLTDELRGQPDAETLRCVFAELAEKFNALVDVLGEVSDKAALSLNSDVLRLYEVWLKTGSVRAQKKLQRIGVYPSENATSRTQH